MKNSSSNQSTKGSMASIFFTVFLDLVGFGIVIPLTPFLAREFQATPLEIGLLMAVYSVMQLFFSPLWGSLSDKYGRRPILLISLIGGALSYTLFAFAKTLVVLFVARALAGVFAATISTAHAYMADTTDESNRSKGMGLIGAAFGMGFIFGPLIGAGLATVGMHFGNQPPFSQSFSALGAALLCLINFVIAYKYLHEPQQKKFEKVNKWSALQSGLKDKKVGVLILIFLIGNLAMALMEVMMFPYVEDVFQWDFRKASVGFAYMGVMIAVTQGYLLRKIFKNVKDYQLLFWGSLAFGISLFLIPLSFAPWVMALTMTLLALGQGLSRPANLGLISILSGDHEQGKVMGVTQGVSSLGRIVGPPLGGYFYQTYGASSPFYISGLLMIVSVVLLVVLVRGRVQHISKDKSQVVA